MNRRRCSSKREGSATAELAVMLPFLVFMFVISVDFARVFYYSQLIENCARKGALYACDSTAAAQSPYTSMQNAALADVSNLSPQPTVTSTNATDSSGNACVQVTVAWKFSTITAFPGIPNTVNLSRTVQMRLVQ
jgi:Flp pilus assembly protein TadG